MDANKLFDRANQAAERGNYDYAIELFQQLLTVQPDHVNARKELRNVERRKIQDNGGMNAVVKILAVFKGIVPLVSVGVWSVGRSHERRMIACEKFLAHNPDAASILDALAGSASAVNYDSTAIMVYEDIKELYPKRLNSLRNLARLYQSKGEIDKASDCFQRIRNAKPNDEEALKAIKDLAALKTMKDGRWEEAGSEGGYRKMLKDEKKAVAMEQEQQVVRTDEDLAARIARVKGDVAKDPKNTKILLQLADLYFRAKDINASREVYLKIKEIDPRNLVVDRRLSELDLMVQQESVTALKEKLKASPDDAELRAQLAKAETELKAYQVEQLKVQVAAAPTDTSLKHKLGYALYEAGELDGALQQFQQSSRDPKHRYDGTKMMGICFQGKKMFDMAVERYLAALEGTRGAASRDALDIQYHLGECYEALSDKEKAVEMYKAIYSVDIGFRDVAKKIEENYDK